MKYLRKDDNMQHICYSSSKIFNPSLLLISNMGFTSIKYSLILSYFINYVIKDLHFVINIQLTFLFYTQFPACTITFIIHGILLEKTKLQ